MSIEQTRAKVIASIWQAVAQSGVDLSALPREQIEKLVGDIANATMITMNDVMSEMPAPKATLEINNGSTEKLLWEGRPFLSLVESYTITNERIRITRGLLGKDYENFELIRVQDLDYSQGLSERMMGIGDIHIKGADPSSPDIILRNIPKPAEVYEILRRAWLAARKAHGLVFREEM
jgi:hypothetical protein